MDSQQSAPPTTARSRSAAGGGVCAGGREDCWSEGDTETLIEAWGDRYIKLNRGNLRQKDWKEVADAVNARNDGVKARRSDVQCKNRIDTLKKKYKLEKSKPSPSKWSFYSRLDYLVGTSTGASSTTPSKKAAGATASPSVPKPKPSTTVTLTIKSRPKLNSNPSPNPYSGGASSKSNESSLGGGGGGGDTAEFGGGNSRKQRMDSMELSEETAYKELARAILRFGEIYERIESSKQQQLMELEKQRMEFTKDLEFQRMNMFTEAQLELEKMKRPTKYAPGSGKKL